MSRRSEYAERTDAIITAEANNGRTPALLLHACCAPCSSYVLEYLSEYFRITVFYYNPNISPASEYETRVNELERLISEMPFKNPVSLIKGEYAEELFREAVGGLEKEPEGGKRCEVCFRLRLEEAAKLAKAGNFDYYTTTLSISPHKNAELLNIIGEELSVRYNITWLPSDFKKKGGFARSTELSKQYGLYRQDYCGCIFSKRDRQAAAGSFDKQY